MKRILLMLTLIASLSGYALAQRTITGTVTSADDGGPLPGVSIMVKETQQGTITDMNGQYSIQVPQGTVSLIYSFVGMKTKEVVTGQSLVVDLVMESESVGVDEVIVTALGIKRSEKSLGYSANTVGGEEFSKNAQQDAMNSLKGKVAGVVISSGGGAPGSSTKVIIRGYSSVLGNNNPLYVVDGTPIDNSSRAAYSSGLDFGNRANDINPNDIESMTVLKGAAATAQYGPRGASGVIMVTTKSGKAQELTVEYNGSVTMTDVLRLPQMQGIFGQGWSGHWADDENGSWGPKMDGKVRAWGNVIDGTQKIKKFENIENNLYDFYDFGQYINNSVSLSGGNAKSNFFLSYSNSNMDGTIPNDVDKTVRNTLSFRGKSVGKNITASTSLNYVRKDGSLNPDGMGGSNAAANIYSEILQMPRDFSIVDLADYKNDKFNSPSYFFTPYAANPYFAIDNNKSTYFENRIYGNISLDYKIIEGLNAKWILGGDISSMMRHDQEAIERFIPGSPQAVKKKIESPGSYYEETRQTRDLNSDFLLNYSKTFSDFSIDGALGFNMRSYDYEGLSGLINTLVIPEFYDLSNTDGTPVLGSNKSKKRQMATYGQATFGYKSFLFLNLSGRNDWSSTLPKDANSFFYPAASVSWIASDMFPSMQTIVPLLKVRASWGKAGNDAAPYSLYPSMAATSVWIPFSSLEFPLAEVGAFEIANIIGNPKLKPEITTEFELGFNARIMEYLNLDLSIYNKTSDGQILTADIAASSGYSGSITNFGKVQNSGIELLATITPIKNSNFEWNLTANYTKNKNKISDLPEGQKEIVLSTVYGVEMVAMEGKPLGQLRAPDYKKTTDGKIIINPSNGIPEGTTEKSIIGDIQPDYVLGIINDLRYKNMSLSFTLDYRPGGYMYSGTADLNYFVGNATQTTYNERQPFIVPNSVMPNPAYDATVENSPEYIENTVPITMVNINAYYYHTANLVANRSRVIPRSYFKLRDVTFTYTLPQKYVTMLKLKEIDIVLSGQNLLLFTPEDNNFIDPEATSYGNDLGVNLVNLEPDQLTGHLLQV